MNIEILVVKAACILIKMANQMAQLEKEHPEFQPFVDNCNDAIALFKSILYKKNQKQTCSNLSDSSTAVSYLKHGRLQI